MTTIGALERLLDMELESLLLERLLSEVVELADDKMLVLEDLKLELEFITTEDEDLLLGGGSEGAWLAAIDDAEEDVLWDDPPPPPHATSTVLINASPINLI